ncbi:DUF4352 domain-containing protein [Glycomyces harbinensis]|uniref:DUF4352 domain-containing protein n=1 Tax=Glycomyces harbinensis TaxID=58114 RepID=A0A1G7DHT1_9ACTN|nr:DUF4352 domain-containing protein [Glycomyces harbinensis]SDE50620.1 protein of unknown function [Glycomyces harbinensis]
MTFPAPADPQRPDEDRSPYSSEPLPPSAQPPGVSRERSKTISVLAMVVGTAALLLGLIPDVGIYIGGLAGIAAIVLGVIGIVKSHWIVSIIGIVLALAGSMLSFAITDAVEDRAQDRAEQLEAEARTVPEVLDAAPVVDGVFEFTAGSLQQGLTEFGNTSLTKQAAGEFVVVDLTVENIGDEGRIFSDSLQLLYDTDGNEYSASSSVGMYLDGNDFWLVAVNPGDQIEGKIVFDVPVGTELATLRLHESTDSPGVEVSLQ